MTKVRGLVQRLDHLTVEDGDVLAIYTDRQCEPDMIASFQATARPWLDSQGLDNVLVIIVEPGLEVKPLDEGDMRRLGWVRVGQEYRGQEEAGCQPDR